MKSKIVDEKRKINDLDSKINELKIEMDKMRKKRGCLDKAHLNTRQIDNQTKVLENRLDKANKSYNESLTHNTKLRSEIDTLRREKIIFENV